MNPLSYTIKTKIHSDGKLGSENPGERANSGFLPIVDVIDDAKALHDILPYAKLLEKERDLFQDALERILNHPHTNPTASMIAENALELSLLRIK